VRLKVKLDQLRVLVLNQDWTPLSIRGWQWGITELYSKQSVIEVDFYNTKIFDGRGRAYTVPAVLARKRYVKKSNVVKCSRKNILLRDELTCQYCAKKFPAHELNMDHVIPKSKWKNSETSYNFLNIVAACYGCNRRKGNKLCEEVGMFPIRPPYIPNRYELALGLTPWSKNVPIEWKPYLEHYHFFREISYETLNLS
jgi:5-methylcytosine-specific restriction endonuclease McrA